jgi:hypothetical protein
MALEFTPEPVEQLKARFPKALERTWNADLMFDPEADRPGKYRAHVFDYPDGIRAIVSLDESEQTGEQVYLHFSFSVNANAAQAAGTDTNQVRRRLKVIPVELLGFEPTIAHVQTTEMTIHLVIPWPQAPPDAKTP